jgi:hypothetical protein
MPIALAEYFLAHVLLSIATDVFQFHSTSLGALEGGRETKDLKVSVRDIGMVPLAVQDQRTT